MKVRRLISRIFRRSLLALGVILLLVLWQLSRELPLPAADFLQSSLSQGSNLAVWFEHASFNIFDGVILRKAAIYEKGSIGDALIRADELILTPRLVLDRHTRRLRLDCAQVSAKNLAMQPLELWPQSDEVPSRAPNFDWLADGCDFEIERPHFYGLSPENLRGRITFRGDSFSITGLFVSFAGGEKLTGAAALSPDASTISANLTGTLLPATAYEFLRAIDCAAAIEYCDYLSDFSAPPDLSINVDWDSNSPIHKDLRLFIRGKSLKVRGVKTDNFSLGLQWFNNNPPTRALTVAPIRLDCDPGAAEISVVWHPETHATDVSLAADMRAEELNRLLELCKDGIPECVTILAPLRVNAAGTIFAGENSASTRIDGTLRCANLALASLPLTNARVSFAQIGDDRVDFSSIKANLFGGSITGRVSTVSSAAAEDALFFDAALDAKEVDYDALRDHFIQNERANPGGHLSFEANLRGYATTNRLDSLEGAGKLVIRDAMFFRIPLFAGLTDFIGRNVPGVDLLLAQTSANADFSLDHGVLKIDDLRVEGNLMSLVADGKLQIDNPDFPIDGIARLRFFKQKTLAGTLAKIVLLPINKMMEFKVYGPITKPKWNYIGLIDRVKSLFQ